MVVMMVITVTPAQGQDQFVFHLCSITQGVQGAMENKLSQYIYVSLQRFHVPLWATLVWCVYRRRVIV